MKENRWLILVILLGLAIRGGALFIPGDPFDIDMWIAWSKRMVEVGPANFYTNTFSTDFFPGWLYFLWFIGFLAKMVTNSNSWLPILVKVPSILADIGIFYLLFKIGSNLSSKKIGLIMASVYFLNPVTIFNGALWGQTDSLLGFWLLLSIYLLTFTNQLFGGLTAFVIALLIKPQALLFALPIILAIFGSYHLKKMLLVLLTSMAIFLLLIWPFFPKTSLLGYLELVWRVAGNYQYTSLNAFNLWWVVAGGWISDAGKFFAIGSLVFSIALVISLIAIRKYHKPLNVYILSMLFALAFFLFPTRVHERYLFPFFVFSPVVIFSIMNQAWGWFLIATISFLHLANLYYAYGVYTQNYITSTHLISEIGNLSGLIAVLLLLLWALIIILIMSKSAHNLASMAEEK